MVRVMAASGSERPADARSTGGERPTSSPLVPAGWRDIAGLLCGFGDRAAVPPRGTVLLERQVHGSRVVDAGAHEGAWTVDETDGLPRLPEEADALIAARAGLVVGVRTADCVPLLLVSAKDGWSAAVHAGWRGTIAGIAGEAVRAARGAGIEAQHLAAALGPSIGPCCYEVSPEIGDQFARAGLPVVRGGVRPHLDLREANRVLLERSGVPAHAIQLVGSCTRCASGRYHSYRADPDCAGRQVSWVGWGASAGRTPSRDPGPRR